MSHSVYATLGPSVDSEDVAEFHSQAGADTTVALHTLCKSVAGFTGTVQADSGKVTTEQFTILLERINAQPLSHQPKLMSYVSEFLAACVLAARPLWVHFR